MSLSVTYLDGLVVKRMAKTITAQAAGRGSASQDGRTRVSCVLSRSLTRAVDSVAKSQTDPQRNLAEAFRPVRLLRHSEMVVDSLSGRL